MMIKIIDKHDKIEESHLLISSIFERFDNDDKYDKDDQQICKKQKVSKDTVRNRTL